MKFPSEKFLSQLSIVILCFFATVTTSQHVSAVSLPNNEIVPAVFVFGDSIVDTGNNNYINTIGKCNFLPYGKDFGGGNQPTGRYTNGVTPSDIIASKFGVKNVLPPYLDPTLKPQDLLTGVSFASGGNGYDPATTKILTALSLSDQLDKLREYKNRIKEIVGEIETTRIISESIYILATGSNDITAALSPFRHHDIPTYTDLIASFATNFSQELYGVGARRIGVIGLPPVGCLPLLRTVRGGFKRECSDSANQASMLLNSKLLSRMDDLKRQFPDARFVYFDIYNPLLDMIQNAAKYGFEVADKGCCGTGEFEVGYLCNRFTSILCPNTSNHIFWDSFHPTEEAYELLCSQVLDKNIKDFF